MAHLVDDTSSSSGAAHLFAAAARAHMDDNGEDDNFAAISRYASLCNVHIVYTCQDSSNLYLTEYIT